MRPPQLGVVVGDALAAHVELEIHGALVEMVAQLLILALALLPAGGDRGDAALHAERRHHVAQRGLEALRAEQRDDAGGGVHAHLPPAAMAAQRASALTTRAPSRSARRSRACSATGRSRDAASAPMRSPCSRPRPAGSAFPPAAGACRGSTRRSGAALPPPP